MNEVAINPEQLPPSWVLTTLGAVVSYGSTTKAEPTEIADGDWVLELEDIEKDSSRLLQKMTFLQRQSKSTKNSFQVGDVLYGKLRPYLNKVLIAAEPGYCTTEILPLRSVAHLDNRYLFYWLKNPVFLKYVEAESHGMNMPRLGTDAGKAAPFALAPRNEQARIANQLDTLLTRIQSCNDRFDAIPALLKRLRQVVLKVAHAGELTAEWRLRNRVDLAEFGTVGQFLKVSSGNFLPAKDMAPTGEIPVYGGNGINGHHDQGNVQEETLVIGRVGFYCGSVHMTPKVAWVTDNALIVRHNPAETGRKYLFYALQAINLRENDSATAQPVISGQKIYPLPIRVPTLAEQSEIVCRVDSLFALVDRIEARALAARSQAQRLTPLVLAKAFRGELVPQDPEDEPASKLLERIASATGCEQEKFEYQ